MNSVQQSKSRYTKVLLLILVAFVAIILIRHYNLADKITIDSLRSVVDSTGSFGPLVFMIIYFTVTLLFLSAAAFSVAAGLLFGPALGSVYVIIAATASAQAAFMIARILGSDVCNTLGEHGGVIHKLINTVRKQLEKGSFRAIFIMRCLFLPYIPVSYAAGLVKEAKPVEFFLATLITNMVFSPAFVYLGDSLLKGPKALILPVLLIALVLSVPKILKIFKVEG